MKWMLWNDGVEMAEFGMTRVRIGLFQHALAHPEANSERFESIEAKLDELRSYLYANRESVRGYAEAYRNGERISTAHVESTVNQLINWRKVANRICPPFLFFLVWRRCPAAFQITDPLCRGFPHLGFLRQASVKAATIMFA